MPEESAMMAETDFSALATKIASLKPDVVMITMNDSAAANIILQAKQAGADSKLRFVANNAAASASFLRIGGKAVEGVLVGTDALPEIRSDALAKTFVANFQKKYNATPDQWNAVGYTIGRLYGNAIAKAKSPLSKQSILDAMIATRDFPVVLGSGKGNFSFTPGRSGTELRADSHRRQGRQVHSRHRDGAARDRRAARRGAAVQALQRALRAQGAAADPIAVVQAHIAAVCSGDAPADGG
jgi:hypothetical protein